MNSYLGTVLVTTPLVGTPLLSALLYYAGEDSQSEWTNENYELEDFAELCSDGFIWNEENHDCQELKFLVLVKKVSKYQYKNVVIAPAIPYKRH